MRNFGLIGFPLGHSFSARFFNDKFKSESISAHYSNFELPDIGDLTELLAEYPDIEGFNVTIPYKELILPYLSEISAEASAIGAVNTVKVTYPDGDSGPRLSGFNTDAPAFARTLAPMLSATDTSPCKALVLGTGGAAKAVRHALVSLGVASESVSRSKDNGDLTYNDLTGDIIESHRIIVNATPLGTFPDTDSCPPIPYQFLSARHICYDLVYNPAETLFMRNAAKHGATVKNGMDMLRLQALMSWEIWNSGSRY